MFAFKYGIYRKKVKEESLRSRAQARVSYIPMETSLTLSDKSVNI